MDSVGNMFEGDSKLPCRIFNCASVGYLWSGYNIVSGEHLNGSQGYMVKLYDDRLYILGRDFSAGEWIPSAQYCIMLKEPAEETTPEETTAASEPDGTSEDTVSIPDTAETSAEQTPSMTSPVSDATDTKPSGGSGCGALISFSSLLVLILAGALLLKRRKD